MKRMKRTLGMFLVEGFDTNLFRDFSRGGKDLREGEEASRTGAEGATGREFGVSWKSCHLGEAAGLHSGFEFTMES